MGRYLCPTLGCIIEVVSHFSSSLWGATYHFLHSYFMEAESVNWRNGKTLFVLMKYDDIPGRKYCRGFSMSVGGLFLDQHLRCQCDQSSFQNNGR